MNEKKKTFWVFVAVSSLMVWLFVFLISHARAHSWYEPDCCSVDDCRPAKAGEVKETPQGYLVQGKYLIPYESPKVRQGKDSDLHICIAPVHPDVAFQKGEVSVVCIYEPIRSF